MKIIYIAPRFHTNQVPIITNLIKQGHDVEFFAQYIGKTEDHSDITPSFIQQSLLSKLIFRLIDVMYNQNVAEKKKVSYFIPALHALYKKIRFSQPDLIILRGTLFVVIPVNYICKITKVNCIYYNQSPLYYKEKDLLNIDIKNKIKNHIKKYHFPKVRITPVKVVNANELIQNDEKFKIRPNDYFLPLIAEKSNELNREYCKESHINILSVGKYRDYKNHFLLVDSIKLLKDLRKIKVKIVGQAQNKDEMKYFESLKQYIYKKHLQDTITTERNIDYKSMKEIYRNSDIFILTSKSEVASVAVIEAMSHGLVTISTDLNGTATYIENGISGYTFKTMNPSSLTEKIENLIADEEKIKVMGCAAYKNVCSNYSFDNYYSSLNYILSEEFNMNLIEDK
jgi:glycosyltransferase involved in cell wall biosynthesis